MSEKQSQLTYVRKEYKACNHIELIEHIFPEPIMT